MNRRTVLKSIGTGSLVAVAAPSLLLQEACGGNAITQMDIVISTFDEARPILVQVLPQIVPIMDKAIAVAKLLKKALENKSADVVTFLNQLIAPDGLFNQITDTLGLIQDATQRKLVSGILLLAGIALRIIATQFDQGASAAVKSRARVLAPVPAATIERASQSASLENLLKAARF